MPQAQPNNHPPKLADRYRVDAPIGEGAHATTWRGWDERLDRPVAIKMLHDHLAQDPVFVQRFQGEAKVAASVRQGNVVDVYDFGQQDGTLYIVMQFVDGENLKSLIQRTAPLPVRDVRRIIGHVLDGLQAIHAAGIVHRDIKPQNVLIGADGVARVTDFGIADVASTTGLTGEGLTIGTVDYMAPEQAQGMSLTPAADLYATGVMLYEMLTGTLPFTGNSSRETMLKHINGQLVPPSSRLPERGITPAIDAVIVQSLAKQPARRFGTARAMKQAVGQALLATTTNTAAPATTLMPAQAQTAQPAYQQPSYDEDAGAGLNGAFKGLIALLFIGAMGVAFWGALQLLDGDGLNLDLPAIFNSQGDDVTPTPEAVPTDPPTEVPNQLPLVEPTATKEIIEPPVQEQPQAPPTDIPPTDIPPTDIPPTNIPPTSVPPTDVPVLIEPTPLPTATQSANDIPIEQIQPIPTETGPTEQPVIDPGGYHGHIRLL